MSCTSQHRLRTALRRLLILAFCAITLSAGAATINVPQDYPKIQLAINAAANGDTIQVAAGYSSTEDIDFLGLSITVMGPGHGFADHCGNGASVHSVSFSSNESRSAQLIGMSASYVQISSSAPTLTSDCITGAACQAIISGSSAPLIQSSEIANTFVPAGGSCGTNVSGITIDGDLNTPLNGLPIGTPASIVGNTIHDNVQTGNLVAPGGGAGITVIGASPIILNNVMFNNSTLGFGGAIEVVSGSNVAIVQNLIHDNYAGCGGGAIAISDETGSGAFGPLTSLVVANNTLVDNTNLPATPDTGNLSCSATSQIDANVDPGNNGVPISSFVFVNNIVSGNTSSPITSCYQPAATAPPSLYTQPIFDHNILFNAGGPIFSSLCVDVSGQYNNINAKPQFDTGSANPYSLAQGSVGIDVGNNSVLAELAPIGGFPNSSDIAGAPRVQNSGTTRQVFPYPVIDVGAYELPGPTTPAPVSLLVQPANYIADGPATNIVAYLTTPSGAPVTNGTVTYFVGNDDGPLTNVGTEAVQPNGTVSILDYTFPSGVDLLYATYISDLAGPFFPPTQSIVVVLDVGAASTTITVTSDFNPRELGFPVTFTVMASGKTSSEVAPPFSPKSLTLTDTTTNTTLATLTPDATGMATFTTSSLALGRHFIVASYAGDAFYPAATSQPLDQRIDLPTTTTLSISPGPYSAYVPLTLTATVVPVGPSSIVPTGTVTFSTGPVAPTPLTTVNGVATAVLTIPQSAGTPCFTASYQGNDDYAISTSPKVCITVNPDDTTLTQSKPSPNPAFAFLPIKLAANIAPSPTSLQIPPGSITGSVSFATSPQANFINPGPITVSGAVATTAYLQSGTYSITASYPGNASFNASTATQSFPETVVPNPTDTTLAAPAVVYIPGGSATLVATVVATPNPIAVSLSAGILPPTGTITFLNGAANLGTVNATATTNGAKAMLASTNLAPGTYNLIAKYSGDPNYLTSTSAAAPLNIVLRDFTLTSNPPVPNPSITIETQHHKDLDLTLTSIMSFVDTVELTCGNLPAFASCNFASKSLPIAAGASVPVTIDIDTDVLHNFESRLQTPNQPPSNLRGSVITLALLLPIPLLVTLRRRNLPRNQGRTLLRSLTLFASLCVLLAAATLTGCTGKLPDHTPPGTYTITVTGTGLTSHLVHTLPITLIVTP